MCEQPSIRQSISTYLCSRRVVGDTLLYPLTNTGEQRQLQCTLCRAAVCTNTEEQLRII